MTGGVRLATAVISAAGSAGGGGPLINALGTAVAIHRAQSEVLETDAICDNLVQLGSDSLATIHQAIQRGRWFVRVTQRNGSMFEIAVAARHDAGLIVVAEARHDPASSLIAAPRSATRRESSRWRITTHTWHDSRRMKQIRSHCAHNLTTIRHRHPGVREPDVGMRDSRQSRIAADVLIGDSGAIRRLRATIECVASAEISVLVEGPTGAGKELVAALLHRLSGRSGAFVAFNVCAIADTMFEDALFGHVRGAYTGAGGDTPGFLREAHAGTLFMDEIGGLPAPLQPKLLRALETGIFRPIGSSRDTRSDFRLVAASNEPIGHLVHEGRFRADLAQRMSGIVLTLPSLDERLEDLPALVHHFARGRPVAAGALRILQGRPWPGNVRELRHVVDAAFVFGGGTLDRRAVEQALEHRPIAPSKRREPEKTSDYLSIERTRLLEALDQAAWSTVAVARAFGVHRSTLYRRLKRLNIALPPSMRPRAAAESEAQFLITRSRTSREAAPSSVALLAQTDQPVIVGQTV